MKYAAIILLLIAGAAALLLSDPIREFSHRDDYIPPTPLPTLTHWTESGGAPVSRDVLEVFRGPEHCSWESSLMLFTGDPIGTRMDRRETFQPELGLHRRQYLCDPEGVFSPDGLLSTYDPDVALPSTAAPTGYSWEGKEMWVDAANPEAAVYVVYDDHVERWPHAREAILCA